MITLVLPLGLRPLLDCRNRCCRPPPPAAPRPRLPHDNVVVRGVDPVAPTFLAVAAEAAAAEAVVVEAASAFDSAFVVRDDAPDPPRAVAAASLPVFESELARTKPTQPPCIPWPPGREEDMLPGVGAPLPLLLVPKLLLLLVPTAAPVGAAGSKPVRLNPGLVAPHVLGPGLVFPALLLLLSPVRSTRPEGDPGAAALLPVGAGGVVVGDRATGGWVGGGAKKDRML